MRVKKSPEGMPSAKQKNLDKKRGLFFEIGLILALSVVLLAFEWTTVRTHIIEWDKFGREVVDEEFAKVTIHEKKKLEMPKPKPIQVFEEVSNETEVDEELEISGEITDETINELEFNIEDDPDEGIEEPTVFFVVEFQPEFPGGLNAMYKYLAENIKYPNAAKEVGIQGRVHVSFIVWNDGSIRNVKLLRGIGGGCDEEALRVIASMPNWKPGKQRTQAVNVRMAIPITFNLTN